MSVCGATRVVGYGTEAILTMSAQLFNVTIHFINLYQKEIKVNIDNKTGNRSQHV